MRIRSHKILVAVVCLFLATVLFAGVVCMSVLSPIHTEKPVDIYVRPDADEALVTSQLKEKCNLRSLMGWRILSTLLPYRVHQGRYVVADGDNMLSVYRRLRCGHQSPVRLTLPPVRRLSRLAGVLSAHLMLDSATVAEAFADSSFAATYGFTTATLPSLFIPNTYEVYWDTSLDKFMQRMIRENDVFWQANKRDAAASAMGLTHAEVATLASIIDEETNYGPERARIAGLYLNRLKKNMPLQADPTVKFAVGNDSLHRILGQHLHIDSPYNTYRNTGLPPGPIRIASIASIDAVLNAEDHDYLYFCAKEDFSGSHNFARTYDEHMTNARKYQQALNHRGIK